ncbi:MAG: toll/interleukin-1 receptor domain-containing protein [Hyphomonadaceae bacterium]|nr:toll/interleukin-1 receptor domain-containing protein [Hyphomonadaceae bacterium]
MADVFISYRKADRAKAEALAKALKVENLDVWWDTQLETGQTFDEKIQAALQAAKAVIVIWSKESVKSDWVRAEGAFGRERGILVPAMIQRVNIPVPFNLVHTADLIGWNGDRAHKGYCDVVKQVKTLANKTHVKPLKPPPNPALRNVWRAIAAVAVIAVAGASVWFFQPWQYFDPNAQAEALAKAEAAKVESSRAKLAPFGVELADFNTMTGHEVAARKFKPETMAQLQTLADSGEPAALALICAVETWDYDARGNDEDKLSATCSQAAEAGDPIGHVYHADFLTTAALYDPRVDSENAELTATAEYKKAADLGVGWGQYFYGMRLFNGEGVEADPIAAEPILKSASEGGLPAGDFGLGMIYFSGKVAGPPPDQAFALIKKAADAGFDEAQFDLCNRLVGGWDWTEDLDAALTYCKASSTSATPYTAEKSKAFVPDVERRIAERDAAPATPTDGTAPPDTPAPN